MNEIKNYGYIDNLSLSEYVAFPIYIVIIFLISYYIQYKHVRSNSLYKYYTQAVLAKVIGASCFCLVYIFVYKGGDTISYFESSRALCNLMEVRPVDFMKVYLEKGSIENYYLFNGIDTGYPWMYMFLEPKSFFLVKIIVPFMFLSFQSYVLTTILLSWASFAGIWRLFLMFSQMYKKTVFHLAISILFIPSVIFWGSGLLKDTVTLSASCWFIYALYHAFIIKQKKIKYFIILLISGYFILAIKPYILFALLPGVIIWVVYDKIKMIKMKLLKYSFIPLIYLISFGGGYLILSALGGFDLKSLVNEASIKQADLKRAEYKGNSFDIGSYNSVDEAVGLAPKAIISGLYRPYIWEAKNVVMFLSGIENLVYLGLTVFIISRIRFLRLLKILFDNPLVLFCLSYSVIFSLIIGLSTSNFGALVRFKIAFLPEFLSALVILNYYMKNKKVTTMDENDSNK